jgi:putative endonuclease
VYIGRTSDLRKRLAEHNGGRTQTTRNRGPFDLIYYEAYKSAMDAKIREKKLKGFKNSYKQLKIRISASLDA